MTRIIPVVIGLALVAAPSRAQTPINAPNAKAAPPGNVDTSAAVPFEDIARPKPGAWPTYHGNLTGNRFSPLDQINVGNVHQIAPRWMFTIQGAPPLFR